MYLLCNKTISVHLICLVLSFLLITTAISWDLYSAAQEVEVAAEKVRARGGPDDSPRGAADHAERAEAIGELVRGSAGQEDGVRQKERNHFPDLEFGPNF